MTRNKLHDPPSVKSQYIGRDPIIRVGSGLAGLVGVGAKVARGRVGPSRGRESGRGHCSGSGSGPWPAPLWSESGRVKKIPAQGGSYPGPALRLRKGLSSLMQQREVCQQPPRRAKINSLAPQTRFDRPWPLPLSDPARQSRVTDLGAASRESCRLSRHGQGSVSVGRGQTPRRR